MSRAWLVNAALFGVLGACESHAPGTGGGDVCVHPAPTDSPFGCKTTYAEQVPALCAMEVFSSTTRRAGACESFQVTQLTDNQNYAVWCFYGAEGGLVGATRCSEQAECGASSCIESAGPRGLPRCELGLADLCGGDAGT